MRFFEVKRLIHAPPAAIWPVLTDATRLADGTFSIVRIEGEIEDGAGLKLWSEVDPKRAFALKVRRPGAEEMIWESGLPLGLFTGVRRFRVTPEGEGALFHMREDYAGPLAGLMVRLIPDLSPSFETFAQGLAQAVEDL